MGWRFDKKYEIRWWYDKRILWSVCRVVNTKKEREWDGAHGFVFVVGKYFDPL